MLDLGGSGWLVFPRNPTEGAAWCRLGSRLDEAGSRLDEAGSESQGEEPETQLWAWAGPWLSAGGGSALGGRVFRPARSSASGAHYRMTKSRLWAPFPTPISSLRLLCI